MNKKDIAEIRRQFKKNNEMLHISEILNIYILKDSTEIYHEQSQPFEMLDSDEQELFYTNFKKVLTGRLDEKLFALKFQKEVDHSSQHILYEGLTTEDTGDWKNRMREIVEKILQAQTYEMDIVVTFIKAEYHKPVKRQSTEDEESQYNKLHAHQFILSSINQTEDPERALHFDYVEKLFKSDVVVNPVINLKKPIGGFLFPCFIDNASDVNHVLYSSPKAHEPDELFIEDVLNAEESITAKEDKIVFEEVVRDAIGHKISTGTLANIYQEVNRMNEEDEDESATLDYKDVEHVLKFSGIEQVDEEAIKTAFKNVVDDNQYELKAKNIVPRYNTKSIRINTKVANITVSPEDLNHVRQVEFAGKRYLMIEVEEETVIDGFTMIPELLGQKTDEI